MDTGYCWPDTAKNEGLPVSGHTYLLIRARIQEKPVDNTASWYADGL